MRYIQLVLIIYIAIAYSCSVSNFERGHLVPAINEPVEIPFKTHKNLILIEAEIHGVKGLFLFDNGFSLSAVNESFSEKARIRFKINSHSVDANKQRSKTKETTVDTVKIHGQTFVNTGFYQIDTDLFLPCAQIDGIIGASIINKANWDIDFQHQIMTISSVPFHQHHGMAMELIYSSNNSAFIPLSFEEKTIKCKIDFGLMGEIKLDYDLVSPLFHGIAVEKRIGISSVSASGVSKIDSFYKLAHKLTPGYGANPLPKKASIQLAEKLKYEGYIGVKYLKKYRVILNATKKQLVLVNKETTTSNDSNGKSYGLALYILEGKWKIAQLNPYDPQLDKSHLMQEVTLLDDQPINRFDLCTYNNYLKEKIKKEEPIRITLKDTDKTLTLPYKHPVFIPLKN